MSYEKTTWQTGDIVTAGLLNHMEKGIAQNASDIETINDSIEDLSADATELKSDLNSYNVVELLGKNNKATNGSSAGITYNFVTKKTCTVSGTSTGNSTRNLYTLTTAMPEGIEQGKTYIFGIKGSNNVRLELFFRNSAQQQTSQYITNTEKVVTVPTDSVGMIIRLAVSPNVTVNDTVEFYCLNAKSNADLTDSVNSLVTSVDHLTNTPWRYIAYGDSLVAGAVWDKNQSTSLYYANEEYKIPTKIASACGYMNAYENHAVGGIGYVHEISGQTILDKIEADDLTDVGLITIQAGANDSAVALGSAESTADDGTICGAIIAIINYLATNAPQAQIVIVSPPPFNATVTPFDYVCPGGWSLKDFDQIVGEICHDNHIKYVSWWDCTVAKKWKEISGGYNSGTGPNYSHPYDGKYYGILGVYVASKM